MNKQLISLVIIFIISLIISALIFNYIDQNEITTRIDYESLKEYSFLRLFFEYIKKNVLYFILITIFSLFGFSFIIYTGFSFITIIYGISMIYFIKLSSADFIYLISNIADYLIYFPILAFFTYNSILISKNIKKIKTNLKKVDIIVRKHISFSLITVSLVIIYSFIHSFWVYIILLMKN